MSFYGTPLQYPTCWHHEGLKRQQAAAPTNFVGCFLLTLSYFFFSLLLLSALNDFTGPSAWPLFQITYSYSILWRYSTERKLDANGILWHWKGWWCLYIEGCQPFLTLVFHPSKELWKVSFPEILSTWCCIPHRSFLKAALLCTWFRYQGPSIFKRFSHYIFSRLKFATYFAGLSGLPGRHYVGASDLTYTIVYSPSIAGNSSPQHSWTLLHIFQNGIYLLLILSVPSRSSIFFFFLLLLWIAIVKKVFMLEMYLETFFFFFFFFLAKWLFFFFFFFFLF